MMPFAAKLGIELDSATADEVVGRLRWQADLCARPAVSSTAER